MLKSIKKGMFPFLIAFSAISVSCSAAFYSVYRLSKLFAGAQFEVIIMAGSLEFAKLVVASLLYQYWTTINKYLRMYLTVATVILVLITSMGIYGFLSAAYQDTYRQLIIKENQTSFLEQKNYFMKKTLQGMIKSLKEFLITSLLLVMQGLNQSRYETPRWLGALEPRYPLLNYVWLKTGLTLKKKIEKIFKLKEK